MPKAFSTFTVVRGKEPLLRRTVCEARYEDGHLYLDHCGRVLKQLTKDDPEWVIAPNPTPQGTTVYNVRTGTQLAFSMVSASLLLDKTATDEVIEPPEIDAFVDQVDSALRLVLDELEVTKFSRLGYREYYYFSFENKENSEKWIQDLGLVSVVPALYESFAATPEVLAVALIMQGPDCRYRIGLNGIERSAQIPVGEAILTVQTSTTHKDQKKVLLETLKKQRQRQINSAFAVILDMDAFLLDPTEPDLGSFVKEHADTNLKQFREALGQIARLVHGPGEPGGPLPYRWRLAHCS